MIHETFNPGDAVEIQRDVGSPWEPATYDKPRLGQERSGWHIVKFAAGAAPRVVKMLEGREVKLDWVAVPSVRIRPRVSSELYVSSGETGIRTSQLAAAVRVNRMTVSGRGSVGIDMDDDK